MIKKCTCKHRGQDALHGDGMRVFNATEKTTAPFLCTVCGGGSKTAERKAVTTTVIRG